MSITKLIREKLESYDALGNKIKIPRLQKGKYYVIGNRVLRYDGLRGELVYFFSLRGYTLYMTRRSISRCYIEKLGDIKTFVFGRNDSRDVFSCGKSLNQVLEEIKTREVGLCH